MSDIEISQRLQDLWAHFLVEDFSQAMVLSDLVDEVLGLNRFSTLLT